MSPEEKEELKQKMLNKIKVVEEDIKDLVELTKPIPPENSIGRISRMDAIHNKSINEAALRQSRQKLSGLRHGLTKIDDPKFGLCSKCGNAINPRRIVIMPESTRCVKCAARR